MGRLDFLSSDAKGGGSLRRIATPAGLVRPFHHGQGFQHGASLAARTPRNCRARSVGTKGVPQAGRSSLALS